MKLDVGSSHQPWLENYYRLESLGFPDAPMPVNHERKLTMKKNNSTKPSSARLNSSDLSLVTGGGQLTLRRPTLSAGEWQTTTGDGRLGDGGVRDCD